MPKEFDRCIKNGGKVRRVSIDKDRYANVCVDKNGKTHFGEVRRKEDD